MGTALQVQRRLPVGAEVQPGGGVHFRVWAPRCRAVALVLKSGPAAQPVELEPEEDGYFSGYLPEAGHGSLYSFRLDGKDFAFPDPASRFQPDGPDGPSQVIDPSLFQWTDASWPGAALEGQVLYELHVGTFTREGTWAAAARHLPELARLGITLIEMMPVADFPGRFGWGYDGVNLFAPTRLYGVPDDLRRFVDAAHAAGLGVILDVVYNHLGNVGNYLAEFSEDYFAGHDNEWSRALNFDGPNSAHVREFFVSNARCWIEEFHFDGLRFDAANVMHDGSPEHVLAEIARRVRPAARPRSLVLTAENEQQDAKMLRPPDEGGYGLDALYNEDFHHSAAVALTGRAEAYLQEYRGSPQELISATKWGFLYQGQRYAWQKGRRGTPAFGIKAASFINCLQNHDQISNLARGIRCHKLTSPGRMRALTALLLLGPGTPMLFQGQEFAASCPFVFFADLDADHAPAIRRGRRGSIRQFKSAAAPEMQGFLPDPVCHETFDACKLDHSEREKHAEVYLLHRDLLRLRREDPVFRAQRGDRLFGAVLGPEAFVLRFFGDDADDRLLLVNLGPDLHLDPSPEPLLAPPTHADWQTLWSSEHPRYGGGGTPPPDTEANWRLPGHAAIVLAPRQHEEHPNGA